MKLTAFGKIFLALVILAVVGFVAFKRYGEEIKQWAGAGQGSKGEAVSKEDFKQLPQYSDPPRDAKVAVTTTGSPSLGSARLSRPLKVAINTWAGHAPGIVANGGMKPGSRSSLYKKKYS